MSNSIRIPIALSKETNKLVNVKDVPNGSDCNCYCGNCNEDLVAVNREIKQKAHFRHGNDSNCEFSKNYESYIHWLAKEVFKNINAISLPQIKSSDLKYDARKDFYQKVSDYLNDNGILTLINKDHLDEMEVHPLLSPGNILLQNVRTIKIDKCLSEKVYKSKYGDIKVDTVLFSGNNKLFIEPFYTCKIDDIKLRKVADINTSTISINLSEFINSHQYLFTIEEFTSFLTTDLISKKWEFIRFSKVQNLIDNLFNNIFSNRIEGLKTTLKSNEAINNTIYENVAKINSLYAENEKLSKGLKTININELFGK
jgi:hypothetical protein